MAGVWLVIADFGMDILISILGNRGGKMLTGFTETKLLPRIIRRVNISISHNQHFVHGGSPGREIELVGFASNPTPVEVTIEDTGKIKVFNHDIPIGETDIIKATIPRETQIRFTLGYYKPILSAVNLPDSNTRWKLEIDSLTLSCPLGTWHLPKLESDYFEVISNEGWVNTLAYVRKVKEHPDGGD